MSESCEKCGKPWWPGEVNNILDNDGKIYAVQDYQCLFCGHTKEVKEMIEENPIFGYPNDGDEEDFNLDE